MNNNEKDELRIEIEKLLNRTKSLKENLETNDSLHTPNKRNQEELNILEQQLKSILPKPKKKELNNILNINHEVYPFCKMIIVLNNMPSIEENNLVLKYLEEWFKELKINTIENIDTLSSILTTRIKELGLLELNDISLSATISNENKTAVIKIGKVPLYNYNNGEIHLMNFNEEAILSTEVLNNNEYETLILFSISSKEDLTDEKIKIISKNTNREKLALDLLENEEEKKIK